MTVLAPAAPGAPAVPPAPAALQSHLRIAARRLQGRTVVTDMSARGQLAARLTGRSGPVATVHLVAQAAGPLNGDSVVIEVDVGPGCALQVRTSAATLALPAAHAVPGPSRLTVRADVGEAASLDWRPEPVILAAGAHLESHSEFRLAATSRLAAQEVLVLGRHGETGGRAGAAMALDVAGQPVLRQRLDTAVLDCAGRWVGWPERVAATVLVAGPGCGGAASVTERAVVASPRKDVLLGSATGPSAADVTAQLQSAMVGGGFGWPW